VIPASPVSHRKVFAHYFPPYPLSFDNRPPALDVYAKAYLRRDGENGKFYAQGGLARTRPLPAQSWQSPFWVQINDAIEILRARRMGVDGFAYDIVDVHHGRWAAGYTLMLETAARVAPGFKIVAEPDCNILAAATAAELEAVLSTAWEHAASFYLADGRLLVTPFAAASKPPAFWEQLIADMGQRGQPIALLPVLLDPNADAQRFAHLSYGESSWGDRDPQLPDVRRRLEALHLVPANAVWMMPVTPQDARPNSSSGVRPSAMAHRSCSSSRGTMCRSRRKSSHRRQPNSCSMISACSMPHGSRRGVCRASSRTPFITRIDGKYSHLIVCRSRATGR
jgi:hypothetical protein